MNNTAKFNLGEISISESVKKKLDSESLQSALKRYVECDWGHVPKINANQNNYIVKNGCRGMILAHYLDSNNKEFWIATDNSSGDTSVYIP